MSVSQWDPCPQWDQFLGHVGHWLTLSFTCFVNILIWSMKELVLDRNVKDKDAEGLSRLKTVHQFYGEKFG